MNEINKTEAEAIASIARKPFIDTTFKTPIIFTPKADGSWSFEEREALLESPVRKTGSTKMHDVESFIAMCKRHGSLANAMVYINADYIRNKIEAVCVFNDLGDELTATGWGDHRCYFEPTQTAEWKRWLENNNKKFNQTEIANFFEQNIGDFAGAENKPTGSDILTFVSNMQETRTVKYGSAVNLQNGMVQIEYVEDNEKAQKGKIEIFKEFSLGISPFFNGSPYQIDAFLRYRINRENGQLTFWYELKKPEKILEAASDEIIKKIQTETGLPTLFGTC